MPTSGLNLKSNTNMNEMDEYANTNKYEISFPYLKRYGNSETFLNKVWKICQRLMTLWF